MKKAFALIYSLAFLLIIPSCRKDSSVPVIITSDITEITRTSAASGGNLTESGGEEVTDLGVCWSTDRHPTTADSKTTEAISSGIFTSHLTGLHSNTTYFVRAYATNKEGTAYGNELSFTTNPMIVEGDTVIFFGDSITEGVGASDPDHCWVSLFGKSKLFAVINYGVSGASLQNTVPVNPAGVPNFRDAVEEVEQNTSSKRIKLCLAFGTNDVGFNFDGWTVAKFKQQYSEVLQILNDKGYLSEDILLISPYYSTQAGRDSYFEDGVLTAATEQRLIDHVQSVRELGTEFGCQFVDIYIYMKNSGGTLLLSTDGLHPNDAGHAAIASHIQTVVLKNSP
ncbi:MAG: SGNH/GDSL hydrolase family protein [Bacteroidales bacterium]|nr:SGNH/GDSL hydrolase family protein [Bacteroidales bacterium]MBK8883059.1 SGNH/GDSL hydrolase family protein [Bacteroidales bacterium]